MALSKQDSTDQRQLSTASTLSAATPRAVRIIEARGRTRSVRCDYSAALPDCPECSQAPLRFSKTRRLVYCTACAWGLPLSAAEARDLQAHRDGNGELPLDQFLMAVREGRRGGGDSAPHPGL